MSHIFFFVSNIHLSCLSIPPEVVISHHVGAPLFAVTYTVRLMQTKESDDAANRMPEPTACWRSIENEGGDAPRHHLWRVTIESSFFVARHILT